MPDGAGGVRVANSPKTNLMSRKNGQTTSRSTAHQYSSPQMPSAASGASKRLIKGSPGPFRPAHTPWGYCDRLGWLVVACGCHPQPSRRPRALKVAAAGSGQRRRGGVLRVTRVTTTGTRVVGRGPGTYARTIRHSYRVVEHEFYEKLKKTKKLPFYRVAGLNNKYFFYYIGIPTTSYM